MAERPPVGSPDSDWSELSALWSGEPTAGAEDPRLRALSRRVTRRARWAPWRAAFEAAVLLMLLGWVAVTALRHPEPLVWAALAYTGLAVAAGLAFSAWNRRAVGAHDLESPPAALAAAEADLARRRRALRWGWGLLIAHALFFVPWLTRAGGGLPGLLLLVGWLALFAAAMATLGRRDAREARELARLTEELGPGAHPEPE
jgi:hypothetical protein